MKPRALGRHYLIEFYECDFEVINNQEIVRSALLEAARRGNATIVTDLFHSFNPYGISGVVVISESHLAIHTWPEFKCASIDLFSCSDKISPDIIESFLKDIFKAKHVAKTEIERGRVPFHS